MYRLRDLRKKRNIKQKDVAAFIGISSQAYGNYENGNRQPDPDTLSKLADYFDVTVDYILGRTNAPNLAIPQVMEGVGVAFDKGISTDGLSEEDINDVTSYIEFIKLRKEKQRNNKELL